MSQRWKTCPDCEGSGEQEPEAAEDTTICQRCSGQGGWVDDDGDERYEAARDDRAIKQEANK
jgi:DnaJ-class molecular chaperone